MSGSAHNGRQMSFWQLIFLQSEVNGGPSYGEELPEHEMNWPRATYLQRRLRYLRGVQIELSQEAQISQRACLSRSTQARFELLYRRLLEQS